MLRIEYCVIRVVINCCKVCIIEKKRSCNQIMAALPRERTVVTRPFHTTGVYFAGPFDMKSFTGTACRITKGYVCAFNNRSSLRSYIWPVVCFLSGSLLSVYCRRGCPRTGYQEISWQFIPAGSPHMGGLWEGAVNSFKKHFHRHAQFFKYTFEELLTVLVRIQACLNSCPLCP